MFIDFENIKARPWYCRQRSLDALNWIKFIAMLQIKMNSITRRRKLVTMKPIQRFSFFSTSLIGHTYTNYFRLSMYTIDEHDSGSCRSNKDNDFFFPKWRNKRKNWIDFSTKRNMNAFALPQPNSSLASLVCHSYICADLLWIESSNQEPIRKYSGNVVHVMD